MKILGNALKSIGWLVSVLNLLGGVTAIIWLAILGQWEPIGVGIVGLVVTPFALSIALIPLALFALPFVALIEAGKGKAANAAAAVGALYTNAVIAAWGCAVMWIFYSTATPDSAFPALLWSYAVGSGPVGFLAAKDQGPGGQNEFSVLSAFSFQIGFVVAAIILLATDSFAAAFAALSLAMLANWLLQMKVLQYQVREEERTEEKWNS